MTLRVSGKNLDIGEALRSHVEARIDAAFTKYGAGPIIGHVTIEPEGSGFRTDCTLHLNSGATLQADAKAREPYASFNRAADKIERRVRRYRKRLSDHHAAEDLSAPPAALKLNGGKAASGLADAEESADERFDDFPPLRPWTGEDGSLNPAVIAEPSSAFKRMTVSKAVMELDLTNAPVLVFRHDSDGRTNIVYRRADGNIGWIDPGRP
ncbi:ribosome hibernation-promoting factor, HPF/YfiA family [Methylocapsa palsarum]|uniref:Ribosome hibernation promoting factor n=1 Tax=Methylocapsa palsarum TaxID=1612308 RepID=A0A1I3ZPH5_9HYPH|nr:ribosome-associated translation inhibitor RaiA [Methylocapsa palsarum]SFK45556.1 ribosomal subunit interface protein [Methylocapsa palsarum]